MLVQGATIISHLIEITFIIHSYNLNLMIQSENREFANDVYSWNEKASELKQRSLFNRVNCTHKVCSQFSSKLITQEIYITVKIYITRVPNDTS